MQDECTTRQPGAAAEEWPFGRPPRFSIRLTPVEFGQLAECADEQGLTMPALAHRLIRKELARCQPEKAMLAVREQLGNRKLTAIERQVVWGAGGRAWRDGGTAVQHWGPDVHLMFLAQGEE